ncbi:efflux RND transporter periplasmic adaptor subunit [Synechococcus sp. ROS8604]|uniref:efflux RND transporter periplasmic adaptor subunit n=1 Tax=Synechococcus sp. ROS8604 TaxID=1442557 RepID=UPI001646A207|nr:efflux RND transporter periplasmic adaptor subunit [Synechococcus sp. ROS8604]
MILRLQSLRQACNKKYPLRLLCLSFSFLVVGCSSQSKAPQPLPLYADTIVENNFRQVVNAEGVIGNINAVPFKPSQSGIVTQVLVDAGQKVRKGQVLLVLEHQQESAALDTARAKAQEAKIEASRYQSLAAVGAASREDAEQKKIGAIAQANDYIDKQVQLSYRYIKAPFDGVVGSDFIVNVGTYVKEGDTIFYLVNNDELRVQMNVPAVQSKAIALGQSVRIYRDRADKPIAEGQINYVAPFFDVNSEGNSSSPANTLTVQASFPNVQVGLKPLELLQAEIQTGVRNLPAIPTGAISMKAQQPFVFKLIPVKTYLGLNQLDEQQSKPLKALPPNSLIAVESPVALGELQDNQFPVLKGLVAGDKVAISQTKVLSSGMPVKILPNLPAK